MPVSHIERSLWEQGYQRIVGVDEAGRGPLAGPVVAGAVILPPFKEFEIIQDSKSLTAREREKAFHSIIVNALDWSIGIVDARKIEKINILEASRIAMKEAINGLRIKPDFCLIDALSLSLPFPSLSIIKGDSTCQCIAAASILAKVFRDWLMKKVSLILPFYGFEKHKGYATPLHKKNIKEHGLSPLHRKTFKLL